MTIPNAQTSEVLLCGWGSVNSSDWNSSFAIHLTVPFGEERFDVVPPAADREQAIIWETPKSVKRGSPELDMSTLCCRSFINKRSTRYKLWRPTLFRSAWMTSCMWRWHNPEAMPMTWRFVCQRSFRKNRSTNHCQFLITRNNILHVIMKCSTFHPFGHKIWQLSIFDEIPN